MQPHESRDFAPAIHEVIPTLMPENVQIGHCLSTSAQGLFARVEQGYGYR